MLEKVLNKAVLRVVGLPKPGGSKRAFINRKTGRPIITEDCKRSKIWRQEVQDAWHRAREKGKVPERPFDGLLSVEVIFFLPRPKSHFRTGKYSGILRDSAPKYPMTKPDLTKLWRSTEDALTGLLWKDDAQIIVQCLYKCYGRPVGACIRVSHWSQMSYAIRPRGGIGRRSGCEPLH